MKYFITENGLVPFKLDATGIISMLKDNIKVGELGYHKQTRTRSIFEASVGDEKPMWRLMNTVQSMIDKPFCIFKHPDLPVTKLWEMINYTPAKNEGAFSIDEEDIFEILYSIGQLSIITSFTSEGEPIVNDYSVQLALTSLVIFKSWERGAIIDGILKDLP